MTPYQAMRNSSAAAPGGTYLDGFATTPIFAGGLTKLISSATASIRVRRAADNVEQDIGFSGDALNTAALSSFLASDSGFLTTVYDQTGNGFDAVQPTAVNQPAIYSSGSYLGRIEFDGSNDFMTIPSLTMGSIYCGLYFNGFMLSNNSYKMMFEQNGAATGSDNSWGFYDNNLEGGIVAEIGRSGGLLANSFANPDSTMTQRTFLLDRSQTGTNITKGWKNGSSQTATILVPGTPAGNFNTDSVQIGARASAAFPGALKLSKLAIYNADTAAIRTSIEGVIA